MKKSLKSILISVLVILCIAAFCACDPTTYHYDYEELKANVERIELIEYDNPSARRIDDGFRWTRNLKSLKKFDFEKVTVVKQLNAEVYDEFLLDFTNCLMVCSFLYYNAPNGLCVRITDKNGDFIIASFFRESKNDYLGSFYADGSVKDFVGSFDEISLFEKYFKD